MKLEYLADIEKIKLIPEEKYEYLSTKKWFARRPEGYVFDTRFKLKLWDGYNHGYDKETDTIHMGLWREVYKMCQEFNYPFNFINKEEFPINRDIKKKEVIEWMSNFIDNNSYLQSKNIKERDYQLRVAASVLKDRYCNISVATSGGKTFIYSLIIFYLFAHKHKNKKFLLVVPSTILVNQFYDDLLAYSDGKFDINIQEIFGEKTRITNPDKEPNIYIGTFQSLSSKEKYPTKWFKQFFSITCDECLHPETLITMSDGNKKMIKDIKVGELVKTINDDTRCIEDKLIEKVHFNLNKGQQMYELEMENGTILKITGNHKIQLTNGQWVKTEDLKGDEDILYIK